MPDRTMFRGDTFVLNVQVKRPPPGVSPDDFDAFVPVDISNWSVWFTAKFYVSDPDLRAAARLSTTTSGVVITNPTAGQAQVTMPPSATANFPDGPVTLVYDVQTKDTLGNVFTVESGTITVNPDVTRATT